MAQTIRQGSAGAALPGSWCSKAARIAVATMLAAGLSVPSLSTICAQNAYAADEPIVALADDQAAVTCPLDGYSIRAYTVGDTMDDCTQYVEWTLTADYGSVKVTDAEALANSFRVGDFDTEGNFTADSRITAITATVSEDGNSVIVTATLGYALTNGLLTLWTTTDDGYIAGCTGQTYVRGTGYVDGPIDLSDGIKSVVPTGLDFQPISYTMGTDTTPASTTFKITHRANVRSMNHIVWLSNGNAIIAGTSGSGMSQTTVAHQHTWMTMDPASTIVSNASDALTEAGYTITEDTVDPDGYSVFTVTATTAKAGEVIDAANYDDNFLQANGFSLTDNISGLNSGSATIKADQKVLMRQAGDTGTTYAQLSNVNDGWASAITSVKVAPVDAEGNVGQAVELSSDQWYVSGNYIRFNRTAEAPIFDVVAGQNPLTITNRWGETLTYPQSQNYKITIETAGLGTTEGTVTYYTGAASDFSIIEDADGDASTTDDQTVVKTWTAEELAAMSDYANGSSQCGMTGFRTFSGEGVTLTNLLKEANVTVSADDSFLLDTTDQYGNTFTYKELFGTDRYFLGSIYTDQDVKDTYAELVKSDDEAGATIELRQLLAKKALEQNTLVEPRINVNYVETLISGDEVATATLPTEESTIYNSLVNKENQYRFFYGVALEQDSHTVTFDTGDGTAVDSQLVKGTPMTSTENTTMKSSYWANSLVIYRGAGEGEDPEPEAEDAVVKPTDPTREGYLFGGWYTDAECTDGNEFDFEANDGWVDEDITLYAKWTEITTVFPDVPTPDSDDKVWYSESVYKSVDLGLFKGNSDGTFAPNATLTRGQLAVILWRYLDPDDAAAYDKASTKNETGMSDVEDAAYYTGAANWAVENGVITGKDNGTKFDPNGTVTAEQLCSVLYKAMKATAPEGTEKIDALADGSSISSWAKSACEWAMENGVLSGYNNADGTKSLRPQEGVGRARTATILVNAIENGVLKAE